MSFGGSPHNQRSTTMEHIHGGPMAGRTVLVTGATSGIGRATALGLTTMGAHLAITGPDRGRTENAALEISAAGGRNVEMFVADLPYSGGRAYCQSKLANVLFT